MMEGRRKLGIKMTLHLLFVIESLVLKVTGDVVLGVFSRDALNVITVERDGVCVIHIIVTDVFKHRFGFLLLRTDSLHRGCRG